MIDRIFVDYGMSLSILIFLFENKWHSLALNQKQLQQFIERDFKLKQIELRTHQKIEYNNVKTYIEETS